MPADDVPHKTAPAAVRLDAAPGLVVRDHGPGLRPGQTAGTGMRGMRELATLIGAGLSAGNRGTARGCEVRLDVPLGPQDGV